MAIQPVEFKVSAEQAGLLGNGDVETTDGGNGGRKRTALRRELPSEWESQVYQLDRRAAGELGFTMGAVRATANTRLLVMDTMRSETIKVGRRTQRWGCGYRLQIEISDISATARLTLPAIAASVEVGQIEASIRLTVKGYPKDDLWDVIPDPKPLDVESYKNYLDAAGRIKQKFMDLGNQAKSVLLATDDPKSDIMIGGISALDLDESSAAVFALREIEDHRPLPDALQRFPRREAESLRQVIEGVYEEIRGQERWKSNERVDDEEAQNAREHLALAGLK